LTDLKQHIEYLYAVFGKYTTAGIHHCPCGCIREDDVKRLYAKSLRDLSSDDLAPYHGSAMYTWGDVAHYKHYLPRILELRTFKRNMALINLDDICQKLEYAKWTEWAGDEQDAILQFVQSDWEAYINSQDAHIASYDLEAYKRLIGDEVLVCSWDVLNDSYGLHNFIRFFAENGITNQTQPFTRLFAVDGLKARLEQAFFHCVEEDREAAEKISNVLQWVEFWPETPNKQQHDKI
jgi:hypothetical protein